MIYFRNAAEESQTLPAISKKEIHRVMQIIEGKAFQITINEYSNKYEMEVIAMVIYRKSAEFNVGGCYT